MECELSSTPKLSLSKLPSKPRDHQLPTDHHMLTPPLKTLASIPFQWEVAPGKPKATISTADTTTMITTPPPKNKAARCLDLPPRLLNDTRVANLPSPPPTTVLDWPCDQGRSLSSQTTLSFSFRKGSLFNGKQRSSFGSWRWGSFKEERKIVNKDHSTVDFSVSVKDASKDGTNVKITRIRRRGSFVNFLGSNSNPLVGIYESFKVAVPWRRRNKKDLEAGVSFTSQEMQSQPPCVQLYV